MDIAKCLVDDTEYAVLNFENLPAEEIQNLRHSLICTSCKKPAYFRKKSIDGKKACFGAHHLESCFLATTHKLILSNEEVKKVEEQVRQIEASNNEFILDLSPKRSNNDVTKKLPSSSPKTVVVETTKRHIETPPTEKARSHRILSVLKLLMANSDFSNSEKKLHPSFLKSSKGFKAKDIFVSFDEIQEKHLGKWKGFWGPLSGAGIGKDGTLWLNTGGMNSDKVSIVLSVDLKNKLRSDFSYEKFENFIESFSGAYILVFYKMKKATSGKLYISGELSSFALINSDNKKFEYIRQFKKDKDKTDE